MLFEWSTSDEVCSGIKCRLQAPNDVWWNSVQDHIAVVHPTGTNHTMIPTTSYVIRLIAIGNVAILIQMTEYAQTSCVLSAVK